MPKMRWLSIFCAAILLALAFGINAQSEPPTPAPAKTGQKQQQSENKAKVADDNNRPAKQSPAAINLPQSPQGGKPSSDSSDKQSSKATSDWWLVIFTGVLALVTAALALVAFLQFLAMRAQARYMRDGLTITKQAADAAEKSASAALASSEAYKVSERAWVSFTRFISSDFVDPPDPRTGERVTGTRFVIHWQNAGRTPAIRCNLYSQGIVVPADQVDIPTFTPFRQGIQRQAPLVPGVLVTSPPWHFMKADIDALGQRKCRIFMYGRADYEAIFPEESHRHTEVCVEVAFPGFEGDPPKKIFAFSPVGPQNSAS